LSRQFAFLSWMRDKGSASTFSFSHCPRKEFVWAFWQLGGLSNS